PAPAKAKDAKAGDKGKPGKAAGKAGSAKPQGGKHPSAQGGKGQGKG
ncbi:efflux transporter periplasmic adaptor subunit, partial [Salinisphaera sp. USBA-960]|nr:efflux transporter periplasmic adaptor subunit [Salifodinibacter halophilus]